MLCDHLEGWDREGGGELEGDTGGGSQVEESWREIQVEVIRWRRAGGRYRWR